MLGLLQYALQSHALDALVLCFVRDQMHGFLQKTYLNNESVLC